MAIPGNRKFDQKNPEDFSQPLKHLTLGEKEKRWKKEKPWVEDWKP